MALDTMLTISPSGIASVCGEWFDEECPPEVAIHVATDDSRKRPTGAELTVVWIKTRLRELNVFRGTAVDRCWVESAPTPEQIAVEALGRIGDRWTAPQRLGYARSRVSSSPLLISPINRVADRVAHFDDHRGCPYCRKWYRNGAALRLHVIEAHLNDIS